MKKKIKEEITNIFNKYKTKDIYKLCKLYSINILLCNLKETDGIAYIDNHKHKFIFLDKTLSKKEMEKVMIHEFGHLILHSDAIICSYS